MSWSDRKWAGFDDHGWRAGMGSGRPEGVFWILGLIVGLHVLKVILGASGGGTDRWIDEHFSFSIDAMLSWRFWTPISYQFVHGGIGHLLGNALGIFVFGRIAEGVLGRNTFLTAFLSIGAAAVVLSRFMPGAALGASVVGASGSLYALLGILLARVPKLPLNLILFGAVELRWIVIVYISIDVLMLLGDGQGRGATGESSGVALWVHLLGATLGFGWAFLWPRYGDGWWRGRAQRKRRQAEVKAFERQHATEQELDRILDKISREGMDRLTREEREFLKRRAQESSTRR